jgi:hypothetical protein
LDLAGERGAVIITKCEALQPHVIPMVQRLIDEGACVVAWLGWWVCGGLWGWLWVMGEAGVGAGGVGGCLFVGGSVGYL